MDWLNIFSAYSTTFVASSLFVYVLCKLNSTFKCYVKFTLYAIIAITSATIFIPIMLIRPKSCKNALYPAASLRIFGRLLLGVHCKVRGHENIVKDSGCVVLLNHQSVVDLIVLAELWPIMDRCCVISKKEIFYIWPFGLAAWLWGTIFIDRLNGPKAIDTINNTGVTIRQRRARVLMFPEGTRSQLDKLLPFKKGAFRLAIASQCPIQPVVVNRYDFLGPNRFDGGEVTINILPAIETKNYSSTSDSVNHLIDKTQAVMQNYLDEVAKMNNNVF